jgi:hypothetical protein
MLLETVALAQAKILILLLHLGKGGGEIPDNTLVGSLVDIGFKDDAKIKNELIAEVLGVCNDDGISEHGILAVGGVDGDEAVAKGLAGDDVLMEDVEIDEGLAGVEGCFRGGDGAGGRLGDNLWA